MFNPVFIRSLVYAGFLSNFLLIVVCFFFREWDHIPSGSTFLAVWIVVYLIHKKIGTW